jgi:hypothetical protein
MNGRDLFYKIKLLNDNSIKWLYQRRINSQIGNIPINNDVEKEWQNLKTIIHNAAYESLGKYKKHTPKKRLHKWEEEIKKIIWNKKLTYNRWLNTQKLEDWIEYKIKSICKKRSSTKTQTTLGYIYLIP